MVETLLRHYGIQLIHSSQYSLQVSRMTKPRTLRTSAPRRQDEAPPGYAIDPTQGAMLRFEASLPRLPVPTLSSTAAKYLETVKPHLTPAEFSNTESAVQKFLTSPQSQILQERLQARAADPSVKNWLSDWWNDAAYMGYRDPVVVFVSYFYVHLDDKRKPSQAQRAAALLKSMIPFRSLVERCVRYICFCESVEINLSCISR